MDDMKDLAIAICLRDTFVGSRQSLGSIIYDCIFIKQRSWCSVMVNRRNYGIMKYKRVYATHSRM